jgi:hypothetical protein
MTSYDSRMISTRVRNSLLPSVLNNIGHSSENPDAGAQNACTEIPLYSVVIMKTRLWFVVSKTIND